MNSNEFDFLGMKEVIKNLKNATEQASTSLDIMNNNIVESVGANGTAWTGEAAIHFRTSWDELNKDIKEFKIIMNNQIASIETTLENMKDAE